MPRKKQAGFVFAEKLGGHAVKIIAHELAHGAFRLEHSFPELPENGNNLMDYSLSGTTLHKHQWDDIHSPGIVLGIFEDDEDAASKTLFDSKYVRLHDELSTKAWASTKENDEFTQDIITEVDAKLEVLGKEEKKTYILFNYVWFDASNISTFEDKITNLSTNAKQKLGKELGISDFNLLVIVNAKYDAALNDGVKGVSFREWFYPMSGLDATCAKAVIDYLNDESKKKFSDGLNEALKERAEKLLEKLKGCKVEKPKEIVIHYKRKGHNKYRTWGEFTIVGTDYKGYILERPKGDDPTRLEDFKRHPAGTYEIEYSENITPPRSAKFNYVTICLKEHPSYKFHCGNRADNSDGCFLINDNSPKDDPYPEAYEAILDHVNIKEEDGFEREINPDRTPSGKLANQYPERYPSKRDGKYEDGASAHKNPSNPAFKLRKKIEELERDIKLITKQSDVKKVIIIDEVSETLEK
jgi:hypothetical protein